MATATPGSLSHTLTLKARVGIDGRKLFGLTATAAPDAVPLLRRGTVSTRGHSFNDPHHPPRLPATPDPSSSSTGLRRTLSSTTVTRAKAPLTLVTERPLTAVYTDARQSKYTEMDQQRLHPKTMPVDLRRSLGRQKRFVDTRLEWSDAQKAFAASFSSSTAPHPLAATDPGPPGPASPVQDPALGNTAPPRASTPFKATADEPLPDMFRSYDTVPASVNVSAPASELTSPEDSLESLLRMRDALPETKLPGARGERIRRLNLLRYQGIEPEPHATATPSPPRRISASALRQKRLKFEREQRELAMQRKREAAVGHRETMERELKETADQAAKDQLERFERLRMASRVATEVSQQKALADSAARHFKLQRFKEEREAALEFQRQLQLEKTDMVLRRQQERMFASQSLSEPSIPYSPPPITLYAPPALPRARPRGVLPYQRKPRGASPTDMSPWDAGESLRTRSVSTAVTDNEGQH